MALTLEGRVFIWGRASFGRLGAGVEKDQYGPVECQLPGVKGVGKCGDWAGPVECRLPGVKR